MIEALEGILRDYMKIKKEEREKNMQVLKKCEVKFISAVGFSLGILFVFISGFFFTSLRSWVGHSTFDDIVHLFHLPLMGASVEIERVGPLCFPWETRFCLLRKLCVMFPLPLHLPS